jgi:hypothetical protein
VNDARKCFKLRKHLFAAIPIANGGVNGSQMRETSPRTMPSMSIKIMIATHMMSILSPVDFALEEIACQRQAFKDAVNTGPIEKLNSNKLTIAHFQYVRTDETA